VTAPTSAGGASGRRGGIGRGGSDTCFISSAGVFAAANGGSPVSI
jgi:hypothetical protein